MHFLLKLLYVQLVFTLITSSLTEANANNKDDQNSNNRNTLRYTSSSLRQSHHSKYQSFEPFNIDTRDSHSRHLLKARGSSGGKSSGSSSKSKSSSGSSSSTTYRISSGSSSTSSCSCNEWVCGGYSSAATTSSSSASTDVNGTYNDSDSSVGYNTTTEYDLYEQCVIENSDIWEGNEKCVYCGECNSNNNKCECKSFIYCQWGWIVGFSLAFLVMLGACAAGSYYMVGQDHSCQSEMVYGPFALCCCGLILGVIFVVCYLESYKW